MEYQKYVVHCLSNSELTNLLPDGRVFRIKASKTHGIPYCTYHFYDEAVSFSAEGKEKRTKYYIQIDINSNGDFTEIEKAIRKIAQQNNWNKGTIYEDIDPDTNLMFKCMRFSFELNTEEV